jgi:hypothetical protein
MKCQQPEMSDTIVWPKFTAESTAALAVAHSVENIHSVELYDQFSQFFVHWRMLPQKMQ